MGSPRAWHVLAALLDVGVECEDVSHAVLVPFIPLLQCVRPLMIGAEEIFNLVLILDELNGKELDGRAIVVLTKHVLVKSCGPRNNDGGGNRY